MTFDLQKMQDRMKTGEGGPRHSCMSVQTPVRICFKQTFLSLHKNTDLDKLYFSDIIKCLFF